MEQPFFIFFVPAIIIIVFGFIRASRIESKGINFFRNMPKNDLNAAEALILLIQNRNRLQKFGREDFKNILTELITNAEDKVLMKDFANDLMRDKAVKTLPKGANFSSEEISRLVQNKFK